MGKVLRYVVPDARGDGPKHMRFLCVFAVPRTGSSHLNKLLRSCPEFIAKSELFHRTRLGKFGDNELALLAAKSGGIATDAESLLPWRTQNPIPALEALHQARRKKIIAFKLFPGHLPREVLETQFLTRDDMGFAVLRRRPIESFISVIKAKTGNTFTLADTTALKPQIDAKAFVQWARRTRDWYDWTRQSLDANKRPFADISYERHVDGLSAEESLTQILEQIRAAGFPDIKMPPSIITGERQDRERDYKARVANWDVFETELRANAAHAKLLDWAEAAP